MAGIIAVYGSARLSADDLVYTEALIVGNALASAGYTVMTGGYDGVMAGISRGAADAGGHVIGVTVRQLELIGERMVNRWVKEEIRYETLRERLYHLTFHPDGYVAMPGGVGTVQEVTEVWQMMRIQEVPPRPFVLYGAFWQPLVDMLVNSPYVGASEMTMVQQAHTPEQLLSLLGTGTAGNNPMDTQKLIALRAQKDRFFKSSPQSPLTGAQKAEFTGLVYYVPNPRLDLVVNVTEFEKQDDVQIQTTTGEIRWYRRYGEFRFNVGDAEARLTIYQTPHGFFLPFVDALAGTETYPAGRYLEPVELDDGKFHVDFNQAYSPYCAYGPKWSCPITPAENRLKVAVPAGEKIPEGEWVLKA